MAVKDVVQLYVTGSQIFGNYGNPSEFRLGGSWVLHERARAPPQRRVTSTWITVRSAITAYPMPVGANGNIFHINLEMNF